MLTDYRLIIYKYLKCLRYEHMHYLHYKARTYLQSSELDQHTYYIIYIHLRARTLEFARMFTV